MKVINILDKINKLDRKIMEEEGNVLDLLIIKKRLDLLSDKIDNEIVEHVDIEKTARYNKLEDKHRDGDIYNF